MILTLLYVATTQISAEKPHLLLSLDKQYKQIHNHMTLYTHKHHPTISPSQLIINNKNQKEEDEEDAEYDIEISDIKNKTPEHEITQEAIASDIENFLARLKKAEGLVHDFLQNKVDTPFPVYKSIDHSKKSFHYHLGKRLKLVNDVIGAEFNAHSQTFQYLNVQLQNQRVKDANKMFSLIPVYTLQRWAYIIDPWSDRPPIDQRFERIHKQITQHLAINYLIRKEAQSRLENEVDSFINDLHNADQLMRMQLAEELLFCPDIFRVHTPPHGTKGTIVYDHARELDKVRHRVAKRLIPSQPSSLYYWYSRESELSQDVSEMLNPIAQYTLVRWKWATQTQFEHAYLSESEKSREE